MNLNLHYLSFLLMTSFSFSLGKEEICNCSSTDLQTKIIKSDIVLLIEVNDYVEHVNEKRYLVNVTTVYKDCSKLIGIFENELSILAREECFVQFQLEQLYIIGVELKSGEPIISNCDLTIPFHNATELDFKLLSQDHCNNQNVHRVRRQTDSNDLKMPTTTEMTIEELKTKSAEIEKKITAELSNKEEEMLPLVELTTETINEKTTISTTTTFQQSETTIMPILKTTQLTNDETTSVVTELTTDFFSGPITIVPTIMVPTTTETVNDRTTFGPFDTTTVPFDTTTIAPNDKTTTVPFDTTTSVPLDTTTVPFDTTTILPLDTTIVPLDTTTVPFDTTTIVPFDTTTVPFDTTTVPFDTTTVPFDTTTILPLDTTIVPLDTTTVPFDITTIVPLDTTSVPFDITTSVPLDTTTVPFDTTTILPLDTTIVPLDTTTVPFDTTIVPLDTTTVPFDTTTVPFDTTTVPFDITTIAPNDKTTIVPLDTTTVPFDTTTILPLDTTTVPFDTTTILPLDTTTLPLDTTTVFRNPQTTTPPLIKSTESPTTPPPFDIRSLLTDEKKYKYFLAQVEYLKHLRNTNQNNPVEIINNKQYTLEKTTKSPPIEIPLELAQLKSLLADDTKYNYFLSQVEYLKNWRRVNKKFHIYIQQPRIMENDLLKKLIDLQNQGYFEQQWRNLQLQNSNLNNNYNNNNNNNYYYRRN
ncbi:mucin-5AC-like [Leptopilina heterotoma]|uniref:mucin-5AC-like n=1 Tax=Leptopilina heterotoma TaxID=63436 RepID=UPI001CAA2260|nr:mucin-5AC-like [Leptopilina heterotoma]